MKESKQNSHRQYLKVFVFKKHGRLSMANENLYHKFHNIIFVIVGPVTIFINNKSNTFLSYELILIPKGIPFQISISKTQPKIYNIAVSPELLSNDINPFNIHSCFLTLRNFIVIPISSQDIPSLKKILKLLYALQNINNPKLWNELWKVGFNFLEQKCMELYKNYPVKSQRHNLLYRFFIHLQQHYKKEHQVKFYADFLCVTPGYLNRITKELSGKSAKQLIEKVIITESKTLLNNRFLTISEIAEELHFGSSSSFSNFFKKHTSFSPSDYRLSNNLSFE